MYYYNSKKMRNFPLKSILLVGLIGYASSSMATAPISEILISNETPIALNSFAGGFPGNGIDASVSKAVSYNKVAMGCSIGGTPYNCDILFTNRETGEKVATVNMNIKTATLNQAPTYHGDYGSKYAVVGWEDSPITHITIKAVS